MLSILLNPRVYFLVIILMNIGAGVGYASRREWTRVLYQALVCGLNVVIGFGKMG